MKESSSSISFLGYYNIFALLTQPEGKLRVRASQTYNCDDTRIRFRLSNGRHRSTLYIQCIKCAITVKSEDVVIEPGAEFKQLGGRSRHQLWLAHMQVLP